jgi:large subunit ribosomal protein L25
MAKTERVTKQLTLHSRTAIGTTGAKAARRDGQVPGVLYGHGGSVAIAIEAKTLAALLASGSRSSIVDALVDGKADSILLREVQRDPLTRRPIAADFQRVSRTEEIHASVAVVTVGIPAGVKDQAGVLDVVTHALDIKGPAGKLPEQLEVDVTALNVNEHITAAQVKLPAGFTLVTSGDTTVVAVEGGRTHDVGAAPEAPAATAEAPAAAS